MDKHKELLQMEIPPKTTILSQMAVVDASIAVIEREEARVLFEGNRTEERLIQLHEESTAAYEARAKLFEQLAADCKMWATVLEEQTVLQKARALEHMHRTKIFEAECRQARTVLKFQKQIGGTAKVSLLVKKGKLLGQLCEQLKIDGQQAEIVIDGDPEGDTDGLEKSRRDEKGEVLPMVRDAGDDVLEEGISQEGEAGPSPIAI